MTAIPVSNPRLPFLGIIPGGIAGGAQMIRIRGTMYPNAGRITINLSCGPHIDTDFEPIDDVALNIDILPWENDIVLNHYDKRGWAHEQISGFCPIQRGEPFEILIWATMRSYKIAINGLHFAEFRYRLPVERVRFIYICRDANIQSVIIESNKAAVANGYY